MAFDDRRVGSNRDFALGRRVFGMGDRDVLRDIDQHRTRAARARDIERAPYGFRQILDVAHQEVVLDTGPGDADGVALLKSVFANRVGRHLAAKDHDRDRIHVGGGDARHGVGDPWATGDQADAYLARRSRIRVGCMHRSLLVANQDVLEFVLLVDRVVDVQDRAARIAEDVLYAFIRKALRDDVRAIKFHDVFPFITGFATQAAARNPRARRTATVDAT